MAKQKAINAPVRSAKKRPPSVAKKTAKRIAIPPLDQPLSKGKKGKR
jgi:hypothetical protein